VFSIPLSFRAFAGLGVIACTACASVVPRQETPKAPETFYTVTAEIALERHEVRVAALEYAAAAENDSDPGLLRRATEVTADCLQPALTAVVAARWIAVDPTSLDAHRAAARAALELHHIDRSAAEYRIVLASSPQGTEAEFAALEAELAVADNVYGARQVADRLVQYFPGSTAALRMQAFTALRADDPAAAVRTFNAALATPGVVSQQSAHRELTEGLWRARIMAGDVNEPLDEAKSMVADEDTPQNQLEYALVLMAARKNAAARAQLAELVLKPDTKPLALRMLGLMDFEDGKLDDAAARFAELVTTGKYLDDALFYLGWIAERHADEERALRLYAQVQNGDNVVAALLHAATILRSHGAAPAADELLDQLVIDEPQRAPEILVARARMYADTGDLAAAMEVLSGAEDQYPDNVDLHYARATVAEEQGQVAAALRELKGVLALRPADPAALNAYGYTLADHGKHLGEARKLIEEAHAAAPKNTAILDSLGWVLYRQGHGAEALPYLNEAFDDDRGGDIGAHLGEVLWHLGRKDEAERVWTDAGRSDTDTTLLKATRQRLQAAN
jgi:tetratricopeptide (TPR) repeat protein